MALHTMQLDDQFHRSFRLNTELSLDANFSIKFTSGKDAVTGANVDTLHIIKNGTTTYSVIVDTKTPPKVG